jgi:hypothetical protein
LGPNNPLSPRCQETHLRPAEFSRPGIFTKREPEEQEAASTSRASRYRQEEYMEGGRGKNEYVERKGEYMEDAKWS